MIYYIIYFEKVIIKNYLKYNLLKLTIAIFNIKFKTDVNFLF